MEVSSGKHAIRKFIEGLEEDYLLRISNHKPVKVWEIRTGWRTFEIFSYKCVREKIKVKIVHMIDTITWPIERFSQLISRKRNYLLGLCDIKFGICDLSLDALIDIAAAMLIYVVVYGIGDVAEHRNHLVAIDWSLKSGLLFVISSPSYLHWWQTSIILNAS